MPDQTSLVRKLLRPLRKMSSGVLRGRELRRARRILCAAPDLSPEQLRAFALERPLVDAEKRLVGRVSLKMSASDYMFRPGWSTSYLTAGLSASRCIQASLDAAGKVISGGAVLDFPCGYGRVIRFLKEMYPDSQIVGSEIEPEALEFCQRAFSVQGYLSNTARNWRSMSLPFKFELIWCGSLITHVDERATVDLLDFFYRHLTDGGICVFTTHGRHVAEMFSTKEVTFDLTDEGLKKVLSEYQQNGYGYADYPWAPPEGREAGCNGISLSSSSRVVELARGVGAWEPVCHLQSGWHTLQDVHAFMRRTSPATR
jgi:SAM-dependent methyltransferase